MALTQDKLIGLRDERGMRPLVLGTMEDGGAVLTSETCALEMINATWQRDLEAGELLVINKGDESKPACVFYDPDKYCRDKYYPDKRSSRETESQQQYKHRQCGKGHQNKWQCSPCGSQATAQFLCL